MEFQFFILLGISLFFIGFWVLIHLKGGNTSVSNTFNLFILSMVLWTFSTAMFYVNLPDKLALFWFRVTYVTASLIPSTFLLFSFIFPSGIFLLSKKKQFLIFLPNILFFFLYFFSGDLMISSQSILNGHKTIIFGPGQSIWNFHFLVTFIYAFKRFLNMYKATAGIIKDRIKYICLGTFFAFLLAGITNGLLPLFFNNFEAIWLGPPLTLTWIVLIAYAIFERALTEIPSLLKQIVIYTVVGILLIIIYFLFFLTIKLFLYESPAYKQSLISLSIYVPFSFFFLKPIRNIVETSMDKIFFAESYFSLIKENKFLRKEIAQTEKFKTLATVFNRIIIEIKNPLTALKGYSQYLERNLNDQEFLLGFSKILNEEVDRITSLVDRLAVHSQQAELSTRLVNLTELIEKTLVLLENNLIQHKIEVEKDYGNTQKVKMNIDPDQITYAFLNIISNAIDAMTGGGKIFIKTEWDEKNFRIHIKDYGCGIPEDSLPLIFNPFYTLKTGYAGLGLSACKEIIERHEGHIFVKSKLYEGSEFTIELPFIAI